ncbi:MAG: bifunctional riboflavin kinase/FAD synthetase [Elusimicrobiota bacterium]
MKKEIVAIGMFDGVHLGHQKVLKMLTDYALKNDSESIVLTFDNIPKNQLGAISTLTEKIRLIKLCGITKVKVLSFNRIKKLSALNFLKSYLKNCFCIIIGYDFRFGKKRIGDIKTMKDFCEEVIVVKSVKYKNKIISSTLIKKELIAGKIESVNCLLGKNYTFEGKVIRGLKLGKKLGFPTANLAVEKEKILPEGVFISKTKIGKKEYYSLTYIGKKHTLGLSAKTVEVHIIDFNCHLYGKKISVELFSKIRNDKKFPSLEKLAKQIKRDLKITRKYFNI